MSKITSFSEGHTSSGLMKWYHANLDCGHIWSDVKNPWKPIAGVTAHIGEDKPCETCHNNAEAVRELETMDVSQIYYMRYKIRGSHAYYYAYKRDTTSPTGVMLITSFPAIPEIDQVIERRKICTVSPTEQTR